MCIRDSNITAQDPEGGTAVQNAQRIVVRAEKKTKGYGEAWDNTDLTFTMSDAEQENCFREIRLTVWD